MQTVERRSDKQKAAPEATSDEGPHYVGKEWTENAQPLINRLSNSDHMMTAQMLTTRCQHQVS
jgi:hypothetical protein